ncbi:hypothetical protein CKO19_15090, partial [Rhodovulum adriaticum]|nr:hypothetical protein [Rhodovulum adriaticum]
MRGVAESLVFAGVAIGLHLALWPAAPDNGAEAAGGGGAALVTMRASNAALAAQVAEWDRPPVPATPSPALPQ